MSLKTDLGFYLISDEEYYKLEKPEEDTTYVLVNDSDEQFLVLRNGKFMGKIDKGLNEMHLTVEALRKKELEAQAELENMWAEN